MPGIAVPPLDRELVSSLRLGDEHALEQVIRARCASLTHEATEELHEDAASAPRVVEHTFIRAWNARDRFESPDALDAFLHDVLHQEAVRERSRRAAVHRMDKQAHAHAVAQPVDCSPETVWSHVAATLHAPPPDPAQAAHMREHLRHEAAEHVAAIAKPLPWKGPLAIALVLAIAVFGAMRWADRTGADTKIIKALAAPDARAITTRPGQRGAATLGDGTQASLGADTKLIIPARFGDALRAVGVEGAASFAVAPGKSGAFTVRAGPASVVATGTAFSVSAYPGEPVVVRVREGSVLVKVGESQRSVDANQTVVVTREGQIRDAPSAVVGETTSWVDGSFATADRPLRDVLPLMKRWYGITLVTTDPALLDRRVSMRAGLNSSREAITALEQSAHVQFAWDSTGKTMLLHDASGTPPATTPTKK